MYIYPVPTNIQENDILVIDGNTGKYTSPVVMVDGNFGYYDRFQGPTALMFLHPSRYYVLGKAWTFGDKRIESAGD